MGKSSQRKGRAAELELVRILREHGYNDVRAGQAVSFGIEPDIIGLDGIHVEVKRRENTDIAAALRQASEDAEYFGDGLPVVLTRGNRESWRVVMTLEDWLELYEKAAL